MFESDLEMRDRLSRTWRKLIERLEGSEFPAHMVYETLAEVAIKGMVDEHGVLGATHLLRLKADAIETAGRNHLLDLISGDGDARAASSGAPSAWLA